MSSQIKIGILTISDRASRKEYEDISGKEIEQVLHEYIKTPWESVYRIVSDDTDTIKKQLMRMSDIDECCLILTTGGTGPAPRDNTPEATESVCGKMLPGFGELMRSVSLNYVPTAILSRQTAGIRNKTLIINLPGKPKSIRECLEAVFPAVRYCIDLINGPYIETDEAIIKAFRPKGSQNKY
jgi:molybdopterin adenylyltransferase